MKTSNKLFIFFFVLSFTVLGVIQLALYANYRKGRVLSEKELRAEAYTVYPMPAPKFLSLKGMIRVVLIASDSFRVEIGKNDPDVYYRSTGDSIIISGRETVEKHSHENWNYYWSFPRVNIYTPSFPAVENIFANGCYLSLSNPGATPSTKASFVLQDAQLWIGAYNPFNDLAGNPEPFDHIAVKAENCTIIVNRHSVVHSLEGELDKYTEITDRYSRIDSGTLKTTAQTKITLTGANFNNITVRHE